MERVELLASYWTLAGGAMPRTARQYSPFDFADRVRAIAGAGFAGMGLWHADLEHVLARRSLAEMRRILDDHGLRLIELEFLPDWFEDGELKRASDERKQLLFEAAAVLGARHVKVGDMMQRPCPMPRLIDTFGALCDEASRLGIAIGFELMPFANVATLDGAIELVHGANAANGGIILDLWHVVKLGIPYAALPRIGTAFLTSVELNDGYLAPHVESLRDETIHHRRLCGEGEFDVRGFVEVIRGMGYRGPWGIEVLSAELRGWPLERLAARAYETTIALFVD